MKYKFENIEADHAFTLKARSEKKAWTKIRRKVVFRDWGLFYFLASDRHRRLIKRSTDRAMTRFRLIEKNEGDN